MKHLKFSRTLAQSGSRPELDHATILGAIAGFGLVLLAIALEGGVAAFFNLKSFLIVAGGTLGATLINFPLKDFAKSFQVVRATLFPNAHPADERINKIIDLCRRARAHGNLALESELHHEADPFLKKCIEFTIDGHQPAEIRRILETELSALEERHRRSAQLFQTMGNIAPAMGLIGTLIGLVQMLQHLNDPTLLGSGMATALLTTFYGAVSANLILLPIAGKLRMRSEEEALLKEITIEGVMGMIKGLNPRLIEQQLLSFLPPEERRSQFN